jgi:hypothetical protein
MSKSWSTTRPPMRLKSPVDVLAAVPTLFGFHPHDSLVLVTIDARERFHVRVDLPGEGSADTVDVVADHLAAVCRRHRVTGVVVAVYTTDRGRAEAMFAALSEVFRRDGVDVPEAIRADGSRWWPLTGCDGPCCPADGTPYDLSSHEFTAEAVLDGQVTLGSREELVDSLRPAGPQEVAPVRAAAAIATRRVQGAVRSPLGLPKGAGRRAHLVGEGSWVECRVSQFLDDGEPLGADDVGRMVVALVAIEVRDVAWALMNRGNAARHVALWRDVVRRCPDELVAPPAALLAFAAWLKGDGALAWCAVDRCQAVAPGYGMARLLTHALAGAVPPTSWRPVERAQLSLFAR